jgi:hypothetical protein
MGAVGVRLLVAERKPAAGDSIYIVGLQIEFATEAEQPGGVRGGVWHAVNPITGRADI